MERIYGVAATNQNISDILDLVVVLKLDFHGADLGLGEELLRNSWPTKIARSAFRRSLESARSDGAPDWITIHQIGGYLSETAFTSRPEDYRKDILAFQRKSQQVRQNLSLSTTLKLTAEIRFRFQNCVGRSKGRCTGGLVPNCREPGAGKTGVLVGLAGDLNPRAMKCLCCRSISQVGGLKGDLVCRIRYRSLENSPGTAPAYLLNRRSRCGEGGPADTDTGISSLKHSRCPITAGRDCFGRSFDLKAGQQYKSLFKGAPPSPDYAVSGSDLATVRHIEVREWSESEFNEL